MDTELTMTTESPMETASPRDVDMSNEVLDTTKCLYCSRTRPAVWALSKTRRDDAGTV